MVKRTGKGVGKQAMVNLRLQFINIWGDVDQEFVPAGQVAHKTSGDYSHVMWASPGGGVMDSARAEQIAIKNRCRTLIKDLGVTENSKKKRWPNK